MNLSHVYRNTYIPCVQISYFLRETCVMSCHSFTYKQSYRALFENTFPFVRCRFHFALFGIIFVCHLLDLHVEILCYVVSVSRHDCLPTVHGVGDVSADSSPSYLQFALKDAVRTNLTIHYSAWALLCQAQGNEFAHQGRLGAANELLGTSHDEKT